MEANGPDEPAQAGRRERAATCSVFIDNRHGWSPFMGLTAWRGIPII
jgi:hypothetical protein